MFLILLAASIAAGLVHGFLTRKRAPGRIPEMVLVYLLVGYCGLAQIAVGAAAIANPDWIATHMARVPPGNPVMIWAGFLLLGEGVIATMTAKIRGNFILGPAIAWSIFWFGATYAHVVAETANGAGVTHGGLLMIFLAHGLVGVLLLAAMVWWLKARRSGEPARA